MSVESSHEPLQIGEWRVESALDQLSKDGELVKLEPRTMRLLLRLCAQPGQVVSSQQLLDDVWAGVVVGPASVYQAISRLRKLLADTDPQPTYIATVPRKGYRLIAPVRRGVRAAPGRSIRKGDRRRDSYRVTQLHRWIAAIVLISISVSAFALWLRSPPPDAEQVAIAPLSFVDEVISARGEDSPLLVAKCEHRHIEIDQRRRASATQSTFSAHATRRNIE
jgi:DNA-binding winged helix-turn-helix (wHTH) protein